MKSKKNEALRECTFLKVIEVEKVKRERIKSK
jgi:hypothetical protein